MHQRFITIEGNIGSGKSTLATMLSNHYDARLLLEEFVDNTFLPKFYKEPERYAFPLELSFLADRYKQMKRMLPQQELFHEKIISDYLFIKSKLFARINLPEDEYELFQNFYEIAEFNILQPDFLIFLHCPVEKLQQNIRKRGRNYEQHIDDAYLLKIQDVYDEYLNLRLQPTLYIDVTKVDFVGNHHHFSQLISFLDSVHQFQTHILEIS